MVFTFDGEILFFSQKVLRTSKLLQTRELDEFNYEDIWIFGLWKRRRQRKKTQGTMWEWLEFLGCVKFSQKYAQRKEHYLGYNILIRAPKARAENFGRVLKRDDCTSKYIYGTDEICISLKLVLLCKQGFEYVRNIFYSDDENPRKRLRIL